MKYKTKEIIGYVFLFIFAISFLVGAVFVYAKIQTMLDENHQLKQAIGEKNEYIDEQNERLYLDEILIRKLLEYGEIDKESFELWLYNNYRELWGEFRSKGK